MHFFKPTYILHCTFLIFFQIYPKNGPLQNRKTKNEGHRRISVPENIERLKKRSAENQNNGIRKV